MYLRVIVVFICISIVHFALCYEETDMRSSRILEHLNMDPKHVLEHEIVKIDLPGRLHRRDVLHEVPVKFQALGMDINLLLRPTNTIFASSGTPVYYARSSPRQEYGVAYQEIVGAMKKVGKLLEDPNHLASVVLGSNRYGRTTVNGYMRSRPDNKPLVIKSLPEHVVSGYLRNRRSIRDLSNDSMNFTYHLVARLNEDSLQQKPMNDIYKAIPRGNSTQEYKISRGREGRSYQSEDIEPVYPQLLIICDVGFQKDLSARGMTGFLEYLLAFWNAVDMVYRHVKHPPIRINIAAIVIAKDIDATPYIAKNLLPNENINVGPALGNASAYFYKARHTVVPFNSCDAIAIMTHSDMGSPEEPNSILGLAYLGGLCTTNEYYATQEGAFFIQDYGAFLGIIGAAHEFGHLLGMDHDLEPPLVGCQKGFIMGATPPAHDASWLSQCSLDAVKNSYEDGKYGCAYDKPVARGKEFPRLIAGKIDDLDKQCAASNYGPAYFPDDGSVDICVEIHCYTTEEKLETYPIGLAASPGTPCGNKDERKTKVCLKTRCVSV